ncbi:lanthionine synthetase LanC family protein [Streptomyces pseudogriseolus]|uniref:lanthionine synthetase LanC family protein n=1 Tax=Streptomyces pseudogriseolus TaxID=36817 RepID=UPI003FA218AB
MPEHTALSVDLHTGRRAQASCNALQLGEKLGQAEQPEGANPAHHLRRETALALNDDTARRLAEHAALQAATDPRQTGQITDTSLCHGWAGLLLTTERIAADAARLDLREALPALRDRLTAETQHHPAPEHAGLLTGPAGVLLTLHTLTTARPVDPEWETCLLLSP